MKPVLASILAAVVVAGCGARSSPATEPAPIAEPAKPAEPPPMPSTMASVDLDAMIANRVLVPLDAPIVSRDEITFHDADRTADPDQLVLINSFPGGSSETAYVDAANRVWIVVHQSRVSAPRGVSISATRTFRAVYQLPPGASVGGRISIRDPAPQGPRAPALT